MKTAGLLALFASAALAVLFFRGLRLHVFSGRVAVGGAADDLYLDPDDSTTERYVQNQGELPNQLRVHVVTSNRLFHSWLSVPSLPDVREGEPLRVEHREFVVPGTLLGFGRTSYEWPGGRIRPSKVPVFLAAGGASAAPLGVWAMAALVAVLASRGKARRPAD